MASLALISPTVIPHGDFSVVVLQVSKFKSTSEKQLLGFGLNGVKGYIGHYIPNNWMECHKQLIEKLVKVRAS